MTKFPTRTIILMALTLLSFVWFFWRTHQQAARGAGVTVVPVEVQSLTIGIDGGGT